MIFVDGVFQAHNAYSVSGTTLTLSAAPASGRVITAYHSTTTVGGSNNTINTMTGDNSDTTLTLSVAPVHENNVQVYFDGVYQSKSNYAISGTTLTFSTAPPTGVLVEAITNTNTSSTTANILLDADSDTKIQVEESSDEDTIRMDIAGTEVLTLTNSAMTLKGTTPTLTIGDAGAEDTKIVFDGNAQDYYVGLDDSADTLVMGLGSTLGTTPAITIDSSQRVLIGTDSGDAFNADSMLRIGRTGDRAFLHFKTDADQVSGILFGDVDDDVECAIEYEPTNKALTFSTNNNTETMRLDSSGNVGIGETSPNALLAVGNGNQSHTSVASFAHSTDAYIEVENTTTQNGAGIIFTNAGTKKWTIQKDTSSHGLFVQEATNTTVMEIDQGGWVTMPYQPAFHVRKSSYQSDIGTAFATITWDTEVFDIGSNFASNQFTAPVTGKYQFNLVVRLQEIDTDHDYVQIRFITSNRTHEAYIFDTGVYDQDSAYQTFASSVLADLDASDTCYISIRATGGTTQTDISYSADSHFSGFLAC
tara:strand:- start:5 stop:1603 length:1599 start_codon:yes stop_codon:yes gene_type:complete